MNKGFTIVELLASIAIMAIIIVISVPAYDGISNTIRENNLNSKLSMMEKTTRNYINKYKKDEVYNGGENNNSICFTIKYLIEKNVFSADNTNEDGISDPINGGDLGGYLVATYDDTNYEVVVEYKESEEATCTNNPIYKGETE